MTYDLLIVAGKAGGGINMKIIGFDEKSQANIAFHNIVERKEPYYSIEVVKLYGEDQ